MKDRRTILSLLWIFLTVNYIYCDVFSSIYPEYLKEILSGGAGSIHITQGLLLFFAFVMEIPMAMIILVKILPVQANRRVNIAAGIFMTLVQIWSIIAGGSVPTLHYIFFSVVEVAANLIIIGLAWRWAPHDEVREGKNQNREKNNAITV